MGEFFNRYFKPLKIGNIALSGNVLMAPLAGYTCFPFRLMARRLGASLAFTEMTSADGLKYHDKATRKLLFTNELESPKAVQLLGSEPNVFEHACRSGFVEPFDIVDINMGCPVPNVIKSGEGCALMTDPNRAARIIEACKRSGKTVTVKCRLGMSENNIAATEFAKICENAGADMITIHGRTRNMMYDGEPLYEHIAEAKSAVSIPVIANGGISSEENAAEMMRRTGADGIMLARYGFENPLIFSELSGIIPRQSKYELLIEQIEITQRYFDELFLLTYIKKLTSYFMKKRPGAKRYQQALYRCGSAGELKRIIEKIFCQEREVDQ
ncbi:MAG: tRNA-dihydrouridine synthase family protein [Oscillospiraceae bacterium]|nr:tRNA-dihydrouridine synthase family protein [Oscillospiraceae bacterium]